jgi:hypothetical protein
MSENEQREVIVSEEEYDRVNRLGDVLLSEELEAANPNLEALMQECAGSEEQPQSSGNLGPDAPILLLIGRGLGHRICRKDLFGPYPKCKADIKNLLALSTHLDKKHELTDVHCRELMRYFIHGR